MFLSQQTRTLPTTLYSTHNTHVFLANIMLHAPTQSYDLFWLLHAVNHPTKNRVNPLPVGATAPLTGGFDCSSPGTAES